MTSPRRRGLALALVAVCLSAVLHAQRATVMVGGNPPVQPEAAAGRGLILGRVVDATTGRPVPDVTVRATAQGVTAEQALAELGPLSASGPLAVVTNGEGFFLLRNLPSGSYNLSASATGYRPGVFGSAHVEGPGRPVILGEGQRVTDAVVKMWRSGVITGSVFDDHGDPAVNVTVRALRRLGGSFTTANTAETDDRGIYRLANLAPGDHLVLITSSTAALPASISAVLQQAGSPAATALRQELASGQPAQLSGLIIGAQGVRVGDVELQLPPPGTAQSAIAPRADEAGQVVVAPTVFHPAAATPRTATVVRVEPGREQSGVDLRLRTVVGRRISGSVSGPAGPTANVPLRLAPAYGDELMTGPGDGLDTAVTATDSAGHFTFLGVPPGDYSIRALRILVRQSAAAPGVMTTVNMGDSGIMMMSSATTAPPLPPASDQPTLSAEVPVSVGDRDLADVIVMLAEGARVTGQVVFEGGSRPPPNETPRFGVSLVSANSRTGPLGLPQPVPVDAEGRFTTAQYPNGRYFLSVSAAPPGWSLKSATVGGIDAVRHPVQLPGDEIAGAVVTLTRTLSTIGGTVRRSGTSGNPEAQVLAFPSDYGAWLEEGMLQRLLHRAAVAPDGTFQMQGLLSGRYLVVAFDASFAVDTRSAELITSLARVATEVSLAEGQTATQTLAVSPLP